MTDEKTERWKYTAHLNYGKEGHGYEYTSIDRPRLSIIQRQTKERGRFALYFVDGKEVDTVEAAEAALLILPVLTLLELEMLRTLTDEWQGLHDLTGIRKLQDAGHSGGYSPGMPETECLHAYLSLKKKGMTMNDAGKVRLRPGSPPYTVED